MGDASALGSAGRDPKTGRFVTGVSGNPQGRRSGSLEFAYELRGFLEQAAEDGDRSRFQALLETLYRSAVAGDTTALKIILDRVVPVQVAVDAALSADDSLQVVITRSFVRGPEAAPTSETERQASVVGVEPLPDLERAVSVEAEPSKRREVPWEEF